MDNANLEKFEILLNYAHSHINGLYTFCYNKKNIEAVFDTDYESDNGLDVDEDEYEEYQCMAFKRISDGSLFEVNYHQLPDKVVCDGEVIF